MHSIAQISKAIDIATAYFEIGALLGLKDEWRKIDQIRILMGDEVSKRTKSAFAEGLQTFGIGSTRASNWRRPRTTS